MGVIDDEHAMRLFARLGFNGSLNRLETRRSPLSLLLSPFSILIAGALIFALWWSQRSESYDTFSGFIEADEIRLASHLGGRVERVLVEEGDKVYTRQTLVQLEPYDIQERKAQAAGLRKEAKARLDLLTKGFRVEETAQAEARVRQMQADLERLQNGARPQEIESAKAELELAQSELELATSRFQRAEGLFAKQAASREELDAATTELRVARLRVQVKTEALALLNEGTRAEEIRAAQARLDEATQAWKLLQTGNRPEEVAAARAVYEATVAGEKVLERQAAELEIKAPVSGIVEAIELQPGDLVAPNAPALTLVDTSHLWVRAYVPENRLDLKIDQEVEVTVDSFPERRFEGRISYIAREAEFTPRNIQTPEERSKQVFRIKVVLTEGQDVLRPGMSADVTIPSGVAE